MRNELVRMRVQVTRLQEVGLSKAAIDLLTKRNETAVRSVGVQQLMGLGFERNDAFALVKHFGGTRITPTDYHPKKADIFKAIQRGDLATSEIAHLYEVTRTYVLRLTAISEGRGGC